jgi:hypothetical protein
MFVKFKTVPTDGPQEETPKSKNGLKDSGNWSNIYTGSDIQFQVLHDRIDTATPVSKTNLCPRRSLR